MALAGNAADLIADGLDKAAGDTYDKTGTFQGFAGNVIGALLAASGMIFLVLTVYAGVLYMTAAGDEAKVKKGKAILVQSLMGIVIIIGAYVFTKFVVEQLSDAADGGQVETQSYNPTNNNNFIC